MTNAIDEYLEKVAAYVKWRCRELESEIESAAVEAAPAIEELREWVRAFAEHAKGCSGEFGHPCKCGLDRIREIVG